MGWSLNNGGVSFFGLLGNHSSLLDFDLLNILAQSGLDGLDDVGLISLEGVEIGSSSDFELGDFCILFNEDGYVINRFTLFGSLFVLVGRLALLEEAQKLFGGFDFLGLSINTYVPLFVVKLIINNN